MLQTWQLEGQKASNGEWIVLDSHSNEPFCVLETRTFNISCEERLKSVKLTQTGTETSGYHYLCINAFDIFGTVYPKKE